VGSTEYHAYGYRLGGAIVVNLGDDAGELGIPSGSGHGMPDGTRLISRLPRP